MSQKRTGIVVAMQREAGVLDHFSNVEKKVVLGIEFYSFNADGNSVCLARCGIGETRAAAATALLISFFNCDRIINYGYVGALNNELLIDEVVAVEDVIHTDVDLTSFGLELGQYDEEKEVAIKCDSTLLEELCGNTKRVRLASSDKFVSSREKKLGLANTFNAQICDMEGAGIASICRQAKVPFALLKIVADGVKEEDCTESFSRNSLFGIAPLVEIICDYLKK